MSTLESGSPAHDVGSSGTPTSAPRSLNLRPRLLRRPNHAASSPPTSASRSPESSVLLLATTIPTMFLAAGDSRPVGHGCHIDRWIAAAGGANTLNSYIDRDIDALMKRTGHRPLVQGEVSPRAALIFGLGLSVASCLWLAATVNLCPQYWRLVRSSSMWSSTFGLKRRTLRTSSGVGRLAASSADRLVGGDEQPQLDPVILFLIVFLWTPPTTGRCRLSSG